LKLACRRMSWTSCSRFQPAFLCRAVSRIGGRSREAITTAWPLPTTACRLMGSSPANGAEPFFASPAGALRPSGPSWRKGPSALAVGASARPCDALHCRRRISCYPARCRAAPPRSSKDRPSIDITTGVHSRRPWPLDLSREREDRAPRSLRHRAPQPSARSVLVVLHHLDGLLHRRLAGLLHPAADPGVHRVSARSVCRPSHASPPMPYPSELVHLQSRISVTGDRCPLAVPGLRPQRGPGGFKALLLASIRSACTSVAGRQCP
jgi:hypothetical protein